MISRRQTASQECSSFLCKCRSRPTTTSPTKDHRVRRSGNSGPCCAALPLGEAKNGDSSGDVLTFPDQLNINPHCNGACRAPNIFGEVCELDRAALLDTLVCVFKKDGSWAHRAIVAGPENVELAAFAPKLSQRHACDCV
jgi:hypothetical protein